MLRLPASYAEVNRMTSVELNRVCEYLKLCPTWPKSVRLNAVCQCLGIGTTGSTVMEKQMNMDMGLSPKALH